MHEVRRLGVVDHLLDAFAAGDDAGDDGIIQAPGERPLGHRHAGRDFGLLNLLDFTQLFVQHIAVLAASHVIVGEDSAGFVFAAEKAAG